MKARARKAAALLALIAAAAPAAALSLSVAPTVSASRGTLGEKLYNGTEKHEMISHLEWERNVVMLGAEAEVGAGAWRLGASVSLGIPGDSGVMRDYDYLNDSDHAMMTNHSVGASRSESCVEATVSAGREFRADGAFSVTPLVQAQFSRDSFERARGAEGWYSDGRHWWFEEGATHYPSEYEWNEALGRPTRRVLAGVSYVRSSFSAWLGAEMRFFPASRLVLRTGALVSPFSYTDALDTHHGSETEYRQVQTGFFSRIRLNCGADVALTGRLTLSLTGEAMFGWTERGELRVNGILNESQPSGITAETLTARLALRVAIPAGARGR